MKLISTKCGKGFWSVIPLSARNIFLLVIRTVFFSDSLKVQAEYMVCFFPDTEADFSVYALHVFVFIFTSGSSALLGHPRCGLSI